MWYKFEQSDWFGINYHIGILVYIDFDSPLDACSPYPQSKLEISLGKTNVVTHRSSMVRIFDEDHGKVTSWASVMVHVTISIALVKSKKVQEKIWQQMLGYLC